MELSESHFSSLSVMRAVWMAMRPPFLILTPAVIFLGSACAVISTDQPISILHLVLVMIAAVSAHISVNLFNEYFDFRSGLDFQTERTPFSGGSGALPANPGAAPLVKWSAIATLLVTTFIGAYFVVLQGLTLVIAGTFGIVIILTYTTVLNRRPWLCLFAPGLAFGPLMVVGTQVALTGEATWPVLVISLIPLFLTSNLLLLNQIPDIEADKSVGRHHFPIAYGLTKSLQVHLVFTFIAMALIPGLVMFGQIPWQTMLALISLLPMVAANMILSRSIQKGGSYQASLGLNVAATILTPIALAATLLF